VRVRSVSSTTAKPSAAGCSLIFAAVQTVRGRFTTWVRQRRRGLFTSPPLRTSAPYTPHRHFTSITPFVGAGLYRIFCYRRLSAAAVRAAVTGCLDVYNGGGIFLPPARTHNGAAFTELVV